MRIYTKATAAALSACVALGLGVAAATPAQAAVTPTHAVSITKNTAKITTARTSGGKTWTVSATFSGTASDGGYTDVNGDGAGIYYYAQYPEIKLVNSRVASPSKPRIVSATVGSSVAPGSRLDVKIRTSAYTSPGVYTVTIPVKQYSKVQSGSTWIYSDSVKTATAKFTINANKKVSLSNTSLQSASWKSGATAKLTLRAPDYQRGAKATIYVKKKGKKKFAKHSTAKLREDGYRSSAKFKVKKLTAGDRIYFKVAKAKYAPAYKTKVVKIKKAW